MKNSSNEQIAMRVSAVSIIWNIILSFFKLFAGIFAHSGAMISDAIHSASDVLSTFIVIIGVKIANRESDDSHPYGHERMECVAAIILAVILFITGLGIGYKGILIIMGGDYSHLTVPGLLALIAAVISILVKEGMFWYTRSAAKKIELPGFNGDGLGTIVQMLYHLWEVLLVFLELEWDTLYLILLPVLLFVDLS